ncbi:NDP-sugar synthase [Candidatus Parcubacteria bacterium]|nr:MAG: NDP-sugar synthase [Candidatus Parcubacteria bacterium]
MAAGLGTRLRPLTDTVPKVMLPIGGKPLLEHTICALRDQGFRNFVVNLHYLPEAITSYFGDGERFGVRISYSDERDQLLETGGAIKKMEPLLSDPFVLVYGDLFHQFQFAPLLSHHHSYNALATIALRQNDDPQHGDIAEIDLATKRIYKWHARPHAIKEYCENLFLNSGLYVLSKRLLQWIPEGRPVRLDIEVIPRLVAQGAAVYGIYSSDPVFDIGTPEKYQRVQEWYQEQGL